MSVYSGMENVPVSNVTVIYTSIKAKLNYREDMNCFKKKNTLPNATEWISVKLSNPMIPKLERKR